MTFNSLLSHFMSKSKRINAHSTLHYYQVEVSPLWEWSFQCGANYFNSCLTQSDNIKNVHEKSSHIYTFHAYFLYPNTRCCAAPQYMVMHSNVMIPISINVVFTRISVVIETCCPFTRYVYVKFLYI